MKKYKSKLLVYLLLISFFIQINYINNAVYAASDKIESALSWATNIANDNSHGYSQANRLGPDYDCSSFISSALTAAGIINKRDLTTFSMKNYLSARGFTWIPWSSIGGTGNLQRGDILLDEDRHTEFYIGNGKLLGAHQSYGHPESGDQTGKEISVQNYYNNHSGVSWDGILRYNDTKPHNCADHNGQERWRVSVRTVLNIRSGAGTSYAVVGTLSNGTEIYITEKKDNGGYTWGKLASGQGWVALSGNADYLCGNLNQTQNYNIKIACWFSNTPMGNRIESCENGSDIYLCYKLYDNDSGKYLDQIESSTYSVKLTIYNPDGSVAHTCSYGNDNNWIAIKNVGNAGTFKGIVEVSGDRIGSCEDTVYVKNQRHDVIDIGVSENGDFLSVEEVNKYDNLFVWYRLYDMNSGELLNSYRNLNYSVQFCLYNPNGDLIINRTYDKADYVRINFDAMISGVYKYKAVVSGDVGANIEQTLKVREQYYVTYDANGGNNAPDRTIKNEGIATNISNEKPYKSYVLSYDANGGTSTFGSQEYKGSFVNWNTKADGTGKLYQSGEEYSSDANIKLYAQYAKPSIGSMAVAQRTGYIFDGWYTSKNGGIKVTNDTVLSSDMKVYAHWKSTLNGTLNTSSLNNSGEVENKVVLKATAYGGAGDYQYKFLLNDSGDNWYMLQNYSQNSEYIWYPKTVGKRTIYVDIKDKVGTVKRISLAFNVQGKPLDGQLNVSSNDGYKIGSNVYVNAYGIGGSGKYSYKFLIYDGSNWYKLQDYSKNSSLKWIPAANGKKTIIVDIKDSSGRISRKSYNINVTSPLNGDIWSDIGGECIQGQQVRLAVKGKGGNGNYTYKFLIKDANGNWAKLQDYSTNNSIIWNAWNIGNKTLYIDIKDSSGNVYRLSKNVNVKAKTEKELKAVYFKADMYPGSVGMPVTLSAQGEGGTGKYTYKFLMQDVKSGEWYMIQNYSTCSAVKWVPGGSGDKNLFVDIKDSSGKTVRSKIVYRCY